MDDPSVAFTPIMFSHSDIVTLLIQKANFHKGLYQLSLELQIGVGAFGTQPENALPGAMMGVSKIGITEVLQRGPNTVDAALVNPVKKPTRAKRT